MSVITSKYRVSMDSGVKDEIIVHLENNQEIKFTSCGHGIYYFDIVNYSPMDMPRYISPTMKQLMNLKSPLLATYLSPLLPPINNILPDTKLRERIMHDYCREG